MSAADTEYHSLDFYILHAVRLPFCTSIVMASENDQDVCPGYVHENSDAISLTCY